MVPGVPPQLVTSHLDEVCAVALFQTQAGAGPRALGLDRGLWRPYGWNQTPPRPQENMPPGTGKVLQEELSALGRVLMVFPPFSLLRAPRASGRPPLSFESHTGCVRELKAVLFEINIKVWILL